MKFLFWNIRGLGKPARKRQLKELIAKERFDVLGVQETIKKDFTDRELKDLAGVEILVGIGLLLLGILGVYNGGEER